MDPDRGTGGPEPATRPDGRAGGGRDRPVYGWLLVGGGALVGILGGVGTGIIEAFYAPLRAGTTRVPLAPVLAVLFNVALVWFTYEVTRRAGLAALPGLAWFVVMFFALRPTTERDVLFTNDDWMALALIGAGSLAWGVAVAVTMARAMRARYGAAPLTPGRRQGP